MFKGNIDRGALAATAPQLSSIADDFDIAER
jgi:hypothetical protein